jgi:hypothetical protein
MLGQGELSKQLFKSEKTGNLLLEGGTTELEGVVPFTTEVKSLTGTEFSKKFPQSPTPSSRYVYTTVNGKTVRVRFKETIKSSSLVDDAVFTGSSSDLASSLKLDSSSTSLSPNVRYSLPKAPSSGFGSSPITSSSPTITNSGFVSSSSPVSGGSVSSSGSLTSSSSSPSSVFSFLGSSLGSSTGSSRSSGRSSGSSRSSGRSSGSSRSSNSLGSSLGSSTGSSTSISSGSSSGSSKSSSGSSTSKGSSSSSLFSQSQSQTTPLTRFSFKKKDKRERSFYDLVIGTKGSKNYKTLSGFDLRGGALAGKKYNLGGASASFKLKKLGGGDLSEDELEEVEGLLGSKFVRGKKDKSRFVQKRSTRISSSGELGEITALGIRSSKQKRVSPLRKSTKKSLDLLKMGNSLRSIRSMLK